MHADYDSCQDNDRYIQNMKANTELQQGNWQLIYDVMLYKKIFLEEILKIEELLLMNVAYQTSPYTRMIVIR